MTHLVGQVGRVGAHQLKVLRRYCVGNLDGIVGAIDQADPTVGFEGGHGLVSPRRQLNDLFNRGIDSIGVGFVPGDEPGPSTRTVFGLQDNIDRGTRCRNGGVGHNHNLARPRKG